MSFYTEKGPKLDTLFSKLNIAVSVCTKLHLEECMTITVVEFVMVIACKFTKQPKFNFFFSDFPLYVLMTVI